MHREPKTPLIAAVAPLRPQVGTSPKDPRAIAAWISRAHRDPQAAMAQWRDMGLAMMPLGVRFSAVRVPDEAVATVTGYTKRQEWDEYLRDVVGGPTICDPRGHRYYILIARKTAEAWSYLAESWRTIGVGILGEGAIVGVPSPLREPDPEGRLSYWAAPALQAGMLCPPLPVLQLIDAALTAHSVESCTDKGGQL